MKITTNSIYHNAEMQTWFYLTVWDGEDMESTALNLRYSFKRPANLEKPELYSCMSNYGNLRRRTDTMLVRLGLAGAKVVLKKDGQEYEVQECSIQNQDTPQD